MTVYKAINYLHTEFSKCLEPPFFLVINDKTEDDDSFKLSRNMHNLMGKNQELLLVLIDLAKAFYVTDSSVLKKKTWIMNSAKN